jgi:hypothetical protein
MEGTKLRTKEIGMNNYLSKPIKTKTKRLRIYFSLNRSRTYTCLIPFCLIHVVDSKISVSVFNMELILQIHNYEDQTLVFFTIDFQHHQEKPTHRHPISSIGLSSIVGSSTLLSGFELVFNSFNRCFLNWF